MGGGRTSQPSGMPRGGWAVRQAGIADVKLRGGGVYVCVYSEILRIVRATFTT